MPGVDFRKSSVVARLSTKCFIDPSGDAKRFVGNSGSGACALLVRSGTIANTASSVFFTSRPGSPAGADMTFSLASVRRKSSAAAMCSITCATDQRSAAGLKFHCASDSPFVASRTFFFVVSRYCSALSFSACVTSCADTAAAPAIKSNAISTPTRDLVLIFFLSLSFATAERPTFSSAIGETGICSIPHHLPFRAHRRLKQGRSAGSSLRGSTTRTQTSTTVLLRPRGAAQLSRVARASGADNLLATFYRFDRDGANQLHDQRRQDDECRTAPNPNQFFLDLLLSRAGDPNWLSMLSHGIGTTWRSGLQETEKDHRSAARGMREGEGPAGFV